MSDKIKAEEAMRELTLILLYLSRFAQGEKFDGAKDFYAWKGYDFDILNELDDKDYIRQGNHPSRSKSVYITESGMEQARELLTKYGIDDWRRR
ncbi:transposase [Clostridiaceae bacterium]|nr:transposase [Clostridiaceae bacterium]RKI10552.1 transposase [bacterium 1XD21-70]